MALDSRDHSNFTVQYGLLGMSATCSCRDSVRYVPVQRAVAFLAEHGHRIQITNADADHEWLRVLIRQLHAGEPVDFGGAQVPEWAQAILAEETRPVKG